MRPTPNLEGGENSGPQTPRHSDETALSQFVFTISRQDGSTVQDGSTPRPRAKQNGDPAAELRRLTEVLKEELNRMGGPLRALAGVEVTNRGGADKTIKADAPIFGALGINRQEQALERCAAIAQEEVGRAGPRGASEALDNLMTRYRDAGAQRLIYSLAPNARDYVIQYTTGNGTTIERTIVVGE